MDHIFQLRCTAKELERYSKRCQRDEKKERLKCKKAIQAGNVEVAKVHAENATRHKNQALNFLRMSARIDATSARLKSMVTSRQLAQSLQRVTRSMQGAARSANLERIQTIMDNFERTVLDSDVQTTVMQETIESTNVAMMPAHDVDGLMREIADEAGLELRLELPNPIAKESLAEPTTTSAADRSNEQDKMMEEALRKLEHLSTQH